MNVRALRALPLLVLALTPATLQAAKNTVHSYAQAGDSVGLARLLTHRNANKFDNRGSSPLHYAAAAASAVSITLLLQQGANVNSRQKRYQTTPLHQLARTTVTKRSAIKAAATALAQAGADANLVDKYGDTPFSAAAKAGNATVVRILLTNAATNISATSQQQALAQARRAGRHEVIRVLETHGVSTASGLHAGLLQAAASGDMDTLSSLLRNNADVDVADEVGATPLLHAAKSGHVKAMELLLEAGANIEAQDAQQQRALHLAAYHGHRPAMELLLTRGAQINPESETYGTPLNRAAERERADLAGWLIERNAAPTSTTSSAERAFGSGLAWQLYGLHHAQHTSNAEHLETQQTSLAMFNAAAAGFEADREVVQRQRNRAKRGDVLLEVVALGIASAAAASIDQLRAEQVQANQRQFAQIRALGDSKTYAGYHARLNAYERIMIQPTTQQPYQLDLNNETFTASGTVIGFDVVLAEYDRRLALVRRLIEDNQVQ